MNPKDLSIEEKRRATWRKIAPGHELGAETDAATVKNARSIGGVPVDPKRLNTTTESQRSSERGALVSYFRDIAEIPTLKKEEEVLLAKEIEAATLAFREGMVGGAVDGHGGGADLARPEGREPRHRQDVRVVRLGLRRRARTSVPSSTAS